MAFPATWGARLRAAAVGLVVIGAVNTVRIGTLSLVATDRSLFDLLHVYVWPAILIVVAVAFVFTWMRRQGRSAVRSTTDPGRVGILLCGALFLPPYETAVAGGDATVYLNFGRQIAHHGALEFEDALLSSLSADSASTG